MSQIFKWYSPLFAFIRVHLRLTLFLCCGALILGLWLLQLTPYLNVADDSGRYMVLGEALARTGDLRLINAVRQPLDTLYPPGFPAMIALWMKVMGRDAIGVILLVKLTQLLLLLGTLPMLYALLERARLPVRVIAVALLTYAACPALISYANEVMSEMPLLFLCLASVVSVEEDGRRTTDGLKEGRFDQATTEEKPNQANEDKSSGDCLPSTVYRLPSSLFPLLALLCAALAFLMRTSGIALLIAQCVWFWRRFGWKWGMLAVLVSLAVVGGWLKRGSHIKKAHPEIHYATYADQFTLANPMKANAGRITLDAHGIRSRLKFGLPTYTGLIPRALLHMMAAPHSPWLTLFYVIAIPMTLLMFVGLCVAWRRGLYLSCGFAALFWFVAAIWPWQNARFLVPLIPFMFLFLFLGVQCASNWLRAKVGEESVRVIHLVGLVLLLTYFANVHYRLIGQERRPTPSGYGFGRSREEGGFYAACAWLHANTHATSIVMGKPQYLLHLYAGNRTAQLEPTTSARSLELNYIVPQHVQYLLQDAWSWGVPPSREIFGNYLQAYGDRWRLAWEDPQGSGVRIWERKQ